MLFGCSNNQKECIDNQINPNGDSELAIVMRNLFDNSLEIKSHIRSEEHTSELQSH